MNPIKRINFIEAEKFTLTYRKMVYLLGGLLAISFPFFGLQMGRLVVARRAASHLAVEVAELEAKRDKILRELAADSGSGEVNARATLFNLIDKSVLWSVVLAELTAETPHSLWLTDLQSQPNAQANTQTNTQANVSDKRNVVLNGLAEDAMVVTQFLKSLSEAPYFENVILSGLDKIKGPEGELYHFSIELMVSRQRKRVGEKKT